MKMNIMKVVSFFIFVFAYQTVYAGKVCSIGADPVNTSKEVSSGDVIKIIPKGTLVTMGSGSGKKVTCTLGSAERVVIGNDGTWILACGNPVYVPKFKKDKKIASRKMLAFNYWDVVPLDASNLHSAYQDCPVGSSCAWGNSIAKTWGSGAMAGIAFGYAYRAFGNSNSNSNVLGVSGGGPQNPPNSGGGGGPQNPIN